MMVKELELLKGELLNAVQGDLYWEKKIMTLLCGESNSTRLHLGVFVDPYLTFILQGCKTIESRFSVFRCAPYESVTSGDIVLLKRSGGPVVALCEVSQTWFYQLDADSWDYIRNEFADALCAKDPRFWQERENKTYATLMRIHNIKKIKPIQFKKRDRRGWVILKISEKE